MLRKHLSPDPLNMLIEALSVALYSLITSVFIDNSEMSDVDYWLLLLLMLMWLLIALLRQIAIIVKILRNLYHSNHRQASSHANYLKWVRLYQYI